MNKMKVTVPDKEKMEHTFKLLLKVWKLCQIIFIKSSPCKLIFSIEVFVCQLPYLFIDKRLPYCLTYKSGTEVQPI